MRTRAGLALALAAAVISGFSVYVNSYGVRCGRLSAAQLRALSRYTGRHPRLASGLDNRMDLSPATAG